MILYYVIYEPPRMGSYIYLTQTMSTKMDTRNRQWKERRRGGGGVLRLCMAVVA